MCRHKPFELLVLHYAHTHTHTSVHLLECELNTEHVILLFLNKTSHSLGLIELINWTDVSKTKITNKMDRLPLVVFPSIVSSPKKNIWRFK